MPDMARWDSPGAWSPARRGPGGRRPPEPTTSPRGTCGVGSPAAGGGAGCVPCPAPRPEGGSVPRAGAGAGSGGSGSGAALGSSQPCTEGKGRRG